MKHNWFGLARLLLGLLGFAAILTQLAVTTEQGNSVVNFFSFFTIQSNIIAACLLVIVGVGTMLGIQKNIALARGGATLYLAITGIVYFLLLSGTEEALQTTVPWVNIVLHYLLPIAIVIDWFTFLPHQRILFKQALVWLAYPLAYFVYTIVRGAFTQWYPYPFINPLMQGWGSVLIAAVGITATTLVLTWLLILPLRQRQS